jgi:hypothetical protein
MPSSDSQRKLFMNSDIKQLLWKIEILLLYKA